MNGKSRKWRKYMQNYDGKHKRKTHLSGLGTCARVILKLILKKLWTVLYYLGIACKCLSFGMW
jgi:hypothetical protein